MYNVSSYATYWALPEFPYKIIEILITEPKAEILWKLLKYNDSDAWQKENLTIEEKRSLIYNGQVEDKDCSVYLDFGQDDGTESQKTFLRIYPSTAFPENRTIGVIDINLEILVHFKINHLTNYKTRVDMITQILIEVLNGKDIGGIGSMFFDMARSSRDKIQLLGWKPYRGKVITMSVNIS